MSGADLISYSTSAGVILNAPLSSDGVRARAEQLLNERDRAHKDQFGHYPGEDPECTQPSREAYRRAAEAQVAEQVHCVIPDGCTTDEAQAIIRQLAPWEYIPDPNADPAVEQARRELAAKTAALKVTRG